MEPVQSKPLTQYNRELLEEDILRDEATLVGEYDGLHVYSMISFICKCGNEGAKKFRSLHNKGGACCSQCAKVNGKNKAEASNLERYGAKNPFGSSKVKEEIRRKYKEKSPEEKRKMIEKRLATQNDRSEEEKQKSKEKLLTTHASRTDEQKQKSREKRQKTYASKTDEEKNTMCTKRKETCIARFGVDNAFKSKEILQKIKNTNIERYGVENVFSNSTIKEKIKETNIEKYGAEYQTMTLDKEEWDRRMEKRKHTNIERFGYENPAQHPETFEKIQTTAKRFKEYTFPSGEIRKIQGYEGFALDELVQIYTEEQIKTDRKDVGRIKYEMNGSIKYYYPDILIPHENKLIEVKSKFTYTIEPEKIRCKGDACKAQGYIYEIWIYNSKGKKDIVVY